jgi:hypothetical protein
MKHWILFLVIMLCGLVSSCVTDKNFKSQEDEKYKHISDPRLKERLQRLDENTRQLKEKTRQLNEQNKEKMRQEWGTDDPIKVLFLREERKQKRLSLISIGMTDRIVEELCGVPDRRNQTITSSHVHEQWVYVTYPRFITKRQEFKYSEDMVTFDYLFHEKTYLYFEDRVLTVIQKEK